MERLEYDPNRSAFIALVKYDDGELSYILAPQRLAPGDKVIAGAQVDVKPGNAMPLSAIPIGTIIQQYRAEAGQGRSAGAVQPAHLPSLLAVTRAMPLSA